MASTKEYLKRVYALELSCYEQQNYLQNLKQQLYQAQHPKYYNIESFTEERVSFFGEELELVQGSVVVCVIIALGKYPGGLISSIVIGGVGGLILGCILTYASQFFAQIAQAPENERKRKEIETYNAECRQKNKEITSYSRTMSTVLQTEINRAEMAYNKTQNTLSAFYNTNIIYKKYWGIVPVAMFIEYFESGRCHTLPEAYDRYEYEIRLDLIITRLDDIIHRLDQIENNQYMLAESIRESNQSIQRLTSIASGQTHQLDQIIANQEVADYYNRINAMNTSYMAWVTFKNS